MLASLVLTVVLVPAGATAQGQSATLFCDDHPLADYAAGRRTKPRLLPVDEAARDPELVEFRQQLMQAVARRDVEAIIQNASEDIVLGFEDEHGQATFRELIAHDPAAFWADLGRILGLGGSFNDGDFIAPYITSTWPDETGCEWAVLGRGVRLRARPDLSAPVVAILDYDLVEGIYYPSPPVTDTDGWTRVRIASGVVGFVSTALLRSPIDQRLRFTKKSGRWQIASFVGGD